MAKLAFNDRILSRPEPDLQKKAYNPGAWNLYTIEANGEHVRVFINDTLMADTTHDGASEGQIALQLYTPTEVYFKDILIRPLP
jgi:uncharacterized protein (DUF427 family)